MDWKDVCDFNPWDEPSTYTSILLVLMLIYTLSVWIERRITFRFQPELTRGELTEGLPGLATVAATASLVGGLGCVLDLYQVVVRIPIIPDAQFIANGVAEALTNAAFGLLVSILAVWCLQNLQRSRPSPFHPAGPQNTAGTR